MSADQRIELVLNVCLVIVAGALTAAALRGITLILGV